jgi:uncharacterized membrane protein YkoI
MKNIHIIPLVAALTVLGGTTIAGASYPGEDLAGRAHVSLVQARAIAVRTVHGTIVSQELETESGGSGLRYTFVVKTAKGLREIGVDAKTGAVLENVVEGAHDKD